MAAKKATDDAPAYATTAVVTTADTSGKPAKPAGFVHPGVLVNRAHLDEIKKRVSAGVEPQKTAFEALKASPLGALTGGGRRTLPHAMDLMLKLRRATSSQRFQLTTDGLISYVAAVDEMLGDRVDFSQLIKVYKSSQENERRYSPGKISCAVPVKVSGSPDIYRVCTSHVERFNLTLRMGIRRMTRLTNAFSKKLENHKAAIALQMAYYNFCRIHQTLKITPAMEAGITEHVWGIAELLIF